MKRILKISVVLLITALAVAAALFFALRGLFSNEHMKSLVVEKVSSALKREVIVDDVSMGLFGIKAEGVVVKEIDSENDLLKIKYLYVKIRLLPLIRKKVIAESVVFVEPVLNIVKYREGGYNFTDLISVKGEKRSSRNALLRFLSNSSIENGTIIYEGDKGEDVTARFYNINIEFLEYFVGSRFTASVRFDTVLKNGLFKNEELNCAFNFRAGLDTKSWDLDVRELSLEANGNILGAEGNVYNIFDAPKCDLKVYIEEFSPGESVRLLRNFVELPERYVITGIPELEADISGLLDDISVSGAVDLTGVEFLMGRAFVKPYGRKFIIDFMFRGPGNGVIVVESMNITAGDDVIAFAGSVVPAGDGPEIRLEAVSDFGLKNITGFFPSIEPYGFTGEGSLQLKFSGRAGAIETTGDMALSNVKAMNGRFDLGKTDVRTVVENKRIDVIIDSQYLDIRRKKSKKIKEEVESEENPGVLSWLTKIDILNLSDEKYKEQDDETLIEEVTEVAGDDTGREILLISGMELSGDIYLEKLCIFNVEFDSLVSSVTIRSDKIDFESMEGCGGGGDIEGEVGFSFPAGRIPSYSVKLKSSDVRVEKLFGNYKFFKEDFTGSLKMDGFIKGVVGDISEARSVVSFEITDGVVKGTDLLSLLEELISKIAKVNLFSTINYDRIKGAVVMKNGVARPENFRMLSRGIDVFLEGNVDLPGRKLDLMATMLIGRDSYILSNFNIPGKIPLKIPVKIRISGSYSNLEYDYVLIDGNKYIKKGGSFLRNLFR